MIVFVMLSMEFNATMDDVVRVHTVRSCEHSFHWLAHFEALKRGQARGRAGLDLHCHLRVGTALLSAAIGSVAVAIVVVILHCARGGLHWQGWLLDEVETHPDEPDRHEQKPDLLKSAGR